MKKLYPSVFCKNLLVTGVFALLSLASTTAVHAQVVTIGTGTAAASTIGPVYVNSATSTLLYSKHVAIYTATEITAGGVSSSVINRLSWNKSTVEGYTGGNAFFEIYMKHVTNTQHPATTVVWATEIQNAQMVYSSMVQNIPQAAGWMDINLTTPFLWNGVDHIEVFVDWYRPGNATGAINFLYSTATNASSCTGQTTPVFNVTRNNNRPNIQMQFLPPVAPNCAAIVSPLNGATNVCPNFTTFSWNKGSGYTPFEYLLYLGTDGGGISTPTNVLNGAVVNLSGIYSYTSFLNDNTTYYWMVVPKNSAGSATGCVIDSMTTGTGVVVGTASATKTNSCSGDTLNLMMSASSGTLQWQILAGTVWNDIGAVNTNPYTVNPTANSTYRASFSNAACTNIPSNQVVVTVTPPSVAGTVTGSDSICSGQIAGFTVAGHTGSVQWQTWDGTAWVDIAGATTATYTTTPTQTSQFRAQITSGVCPPAFSNSKTVNVITINDPVTTDGGRCGPGIVTLGASGVGQLNWFANVSGGDPLATGINYSPNLAATTTFYVQSKVGPSYKVGPLSNGIGTQTYTVSATWGMSFNVSTTATLERVYVYPGNTSGNITINLRATSGGAILQTKTVPVIAFTAKMAVDLEWTIPPANGYRLEMAAGSVQMGQNTSGAVYPYTAAGSPISITGYFNPNPATGTTYIYFYDWQVSAGCKSNRIPVTGHIGAPPPNVTFSGLNSSYCANAAAATLTGSPAGGTFSGPGISGSVFTPATAGAGAHLVEYTFADSIGCATTVSQPVTVIPVPAVPTISQIGNTMISSSSTGNQWYLNGNPILGATGVNYTGTQSGTYTVRVTINGCASISAQHNFVFSSVNEADALQVALYPNPSSGQFRISVPSSGQDHLMISMFDQLGRNVLMQRIEATGDITESMIDAGYLPAGLYVIRITAGEQLVISRITLMK